ncbi:MAG: alpha/beta hydrolase, partial [Oligoflexia bacterium]|nr:alpha/beta hydrolase [Oligoflexia bacterium]
MDNKLNYKKLGSGDQALVFAHGILGYWRNFYSVSQAFKEDCACLLYDQRGHGLSFHKEPYTVEELAQDLKELLEFLDLKSVVLAGHSLGGWVCLYLAYKEPDLVKKLIVIDSS